MKSLKLTALVSIAILALVATVVAQGPQDPVQSRYPARCTS